MQEPFMRPRRSRMPSMSSDDESGVRHRVLTEASTSSEESMQVEGENSQESDQSDDALEKDVEITEGGWICRVERFQKHVDSKGRIRFRHPRKDMADARKPERLNKDQVEKNVQRSIISCICHTTRRRHRRHQDYIESETYIEIKSPLILEVLREYTSYGQQV